MTADELKAIAERQADQDRKFPHLICQCNTPLCGQCSVRKLLSHTQDIRRDTAREIVEAIEAKYAEWQCDSENWIADGHKHAAKVALDHSHAAQKLAASIRSTYGLTTHTEEGTK